ncbi:TonB-dependent receptor [Altererythrobacter sp.]|uniref:TonB-dependent receptor n=3 Tax=Altererythrobacter sp. TaxID=1872480 RepID=UPI003CFFEE5E
MKIKYLLAASVVSLSAAATMAPSVAQAQQITSGIEGRVLDEDGNAVSNAAVTVTDTRTGQTRTLKAGQDGNFRVGSLVPGGPYTVTATAPGFEGQTVEDQFINISGNTGFTFRLASLESGAAENVIIVTGARVSATQLAVGPGIAFDEQTLEAFPSITRDVRDIIRIDPRVSLDRSNEVDRISCLGGNDRSNTFTVDGIVQADTFGLNGTPFAARNALPIPFDAIAQTSVEFAPFDVEYSDFTGCLVNVVTKSGSNDFHGTAFFAFRNSDLRGNKVDGLDRTTDPFTEKRWGATLSGPIIKDRLFFFAGYEETDLGDANDYGPTGMGFVNEADFVDQAQFDRFAQIAQNVYGQDIGGYPRTLPESSVRYFGRLDAYITEDHRLELAYQRLEETNVESDNGNNELTGLNSFEDEGTISNYYSARLYSDWTDKVSTELRFSRSEVGDVQGPVGGGEAQSDNPITRLSVGVSLPDGSGGTNYGALSTGPGIFRSANQLDQTVDQYKFQINVDGGDHAFKIGAELNDLQVYNLFAINATGTLYFDNLDDFENGILSDGFTFFPDAEEIGQGLAYGADINATPSGDINEAAARFGRQIWSVYAQDDWNVSDRLDVSLGVRVQWYDGDAPRYNPAFVARYGFTNANPFSKLDPVILPRASFTYDLNTEGMFAGARLTGGVGMFSGGDPVVYFSNAFSNNGFSTGLGTSVFCGATPTNVLDASGNFTGFPQCVKDAGSASAAAGLSDTQSTDPDFDVPTVLRANLGFKSELNLTDSGFFSGWNLNLDYIYSKFIDPLNFVDLAAVVNPSLGLNGFMIDGRPIYRSIDPSNAGCTAVLQGTGGTPPVYTNVNSPCFATSRDDEIQLTNGRSYESHVGSIILSKKFNGGIFTDGGSTFVNFGYAYTNADNFRNANSSTATSSYDESAAFDRQNPAIGRSNYETTHRFSFAINFKEQFFSDYQTNLGFYYTAQQGRPYSLTFDGRGVWGDSNSGSDNALLYVPTGIDDPNVSPSSDPAAISALIDYVAASGCGYTAGQTIKRNTCSDDWHHDLDVRISQEIPGPASLFGFVDDRIELFADIDNFLNMLNSRWNTRRARGIFGDGQLVDVVDGDFDTEGRYVIDDFNPDDTQQISTSSSIWRIQLGVRYQF